MNYYKSDGDNTSSTSSIVPYDKIMSELDNITEEKKELDIKYNLEDNKHDLEKLIESEKKEIKRLIKKIDDNKEIKKKSSKEKKSKSKLKVFNFSSNKCTKKGYYLSIACVIILAIVIYFLVKKLKSDK